MFLGLGLGLGFSVHAGGFSPASMFADGAAGDEWRPEREWCYTRTVGGVYEPVTTTGDFVARHTGAVNGINDEQLSPSKRPSYNEGGGLSWLAYDGIDDGTATAAIDFSGSDKMSVFAGVRKLSDSNLGMFYELSPSIGSNNGAFWSLPSYLGTASNTGAVWNVAGKGTLAGSAITPETFPAPQTVVQTHLVDISGDRVTLRINGTQAAQTTSNLGSGNFGNYQLFTGARNASSLFFTGRNYGRTVIGKLASAAEIAAMEVYYARKSGVTL